MGNDRRRNGNSDFAAGQIGSHLSHNVQQGSFEAMKGMDLFREIVKEKYNVDFDQKKGNLFEFIEAAKFNRNAANDGKTVRAFVTHAIGEPHAPDDIRLMDNGKIIERVQAKVNNLDSAHNKAAAVREISNSKYNGMQRDVPTGNKEPLDKLLDKRIGNGNIYEDDYKDTRHNLVEGLTDKRDGTNSGGTSIDELKKASANPDRYAFDFEMKQYVKEVGVTTVNTAAASAVIKGTISSVQNLWAVLQDKKELDEALKDIGVDTAKGLARGGATGFLSSIFRIGGQKAGVALLADSSAATALAGGVLDTGLAIYAYAKGEITSEQLKESLQDTTVKTVSTVYFTKAVEFALGKAAGPFLPIAVYTVANYVVTTCREIIREAKLNAAEYNRIAALYMESTNQIREQRKIIEQQMGKYVADKKAILGGFLDNFEGGMIDSNNYDNAIYAINTFAKQYGLSLKHADFSDFKKSMLKDEDFVL